MEMRKSNEELERIQSINLYGEKPGLKKSPIEISEKKSPSKTKELHFAQKDINQFSKSWKTSESIRTRAESELVNARQTVKNLTLQIQESNLKTNAQRRELETLKKSDKSQENSALDDVGKSDSACKYAEAQEELQSAKQELCELKLEMAHAMEMKAEANKETDAAISRIRSCSRTIETLRKEIEEANEEQVLVELARIEAVREFGAVKAQREAESAEFVNKMEKIKRRMKDVTREVDRTKELEITLGITNSEVSVLQNELMLVKAMEIRSDAAKASGEDTSHMVEDKSTTLSLLQSVTEEMEASNKELARIKRGGFKLMASMDIIREECKSVSEETARLRKAERETDATIQNLNTKLLRAKNRLEAASSAEEKAASIVLNLTTTFQQLKSESDTARRESGLINEEMVRINEEKQKNESEIKSTEEKLQSAVQELEQVKSSEAMALEKLKILAEKTVKARASKSQHSSSITISKFEYEYLMGRAKRAEAVAEKKVVAAEAWIEAVKVGEKEMELKREIAEREIRELSLMEDQELYRTVKSLRESLDSESEIHSARQLQQEKLAEILKSSQLEEALPSKATEDLANKTPSKAFISKAAMEYGTATPSRRGRGRRVPGSPGGRHLIHSGSITLRKRRKVVPNLVNKLFSSSNNKNLMNDDEQL
ncbi:protein PLASTID MOVEMENT IMPAIRED 2-like [Papaver somniferum]|uniref:protein PLASTID MOVEMENT IMPAIRED 2-like n=1 Tax=Papaver somniferum TaxID=3469 RepID=UPI000E7036EE|nr:protein PLASTID MOVEMENT IMPAIRED 2-like [Papaver somniferum]XP_026386969.1 protein PLASTID MOVEMENT IMPAIRED 2-like [Papaver somniferum]